MKKAFFYLFTQSLFSLASANAEITNPGFEDGWQGWTKIDKSGKAIALSQDAHSGKNSAKITSATGYFAQSVLVQAHTNYYVTAQVRGSGILGVKIGEKLYYEKQKKSKKWRQRRVKFNSGDATKITIFAQYNSKKGLFDDFALIQKGGKAIQNNSGVSINAGGLSPDFPPGRNFDLLGWSLTLPVDENNDGKADRIGERKLAKGYADSRYFYTAKDGGMVFVAPNVGAKTSQNTKYTRTELREMLRRGNKNIKTRGKDGATNANNWVFSSAPRHTQKNSGGVDGVLKATLAINRVSETGKKSQVGRVIVGQIHAKHNEPIRIYYRKLPGNKRGSIYAAHEPAEGEERWYDVIGSRADNAPDPVDGIALNKKFTYEIIAVGYDLQLIISQHDQVRATLAIDMRGSGYDKKGNYMYFKAGLYNQNNSGDPDELSQVTFYQLEHTHAKYKP